MSVFKALASGSLQLPARPARIDAAADDVTVLVFADRPQHTPRHRRASLQPTDMWKNAGGKRAVAELDVGESVLLRRYGRVVRANLPALQYVHYRCLTNFNGHTLANLNDLTTYDTGWAIYQVLGAATVQTARQRHQGNTSWRPLRRLDDDGPVLREL